MCAERKPISVSSELAVVIVFSRETIFSVCFRSKSSRIEKRRECRRLDTRRDFMTRFIVQGHFSRVWLKWATSLSLSLLSLSAERGTAARPSVSARPRGRLRIAGGRRWTWVSPAVMEEERTRRPEASPDNSWTLHWSESGKRLHHRKISSRAAEVEITPVVLLQDCDRIVLTLYSFLNVLLHLHFMMIFLLLCI